VNGRPNREEADSGGVRLVNVAPVLLSPDLRRTADYYRAVLGFRVVEHYEAEEPFAAAYRDSVEIVIVQARYGDVAANRVRYGAGYDLYLDPETVAGVDLMYAELTAKGARIVSSPASTDYGSYEFAVEDVDGRLVGIGRIRDREIFFGSGVD
jgi:catechol 2,3-dioxygenase-like lactoylglutathione lyase family enzyme